MNIKNVMLIIIILTVPYLILFGNFLFYFYNEDFYYKQFEKNNVNVEGKKNILDNLLNFFNGNEDLDYFNENERLHLIDVKNLINKFITAFYIVLILDILLLIILFTRFRKFLKKNISKILLYSGSLTIFVMFIFLILSLNFDFLFDNFHRLFFAGNWLFPEESLLIQLFPFEFFRDYFLKILTDSFLVSVIFVLIGLYTKNSE